MTADLLEQAALALEARAALRERAALELARTAAELIDAGSSLGVEPLLRASRQHRVRALQDRAKAAALRALSEGNNDDRD
jgi:hypothetical protein